MSTEMLERRFAAIGARMTLSGDGRGDPRIDVRSDRRGEFFAAIPENARGVTGVRAAKVALQPPLVRAAIERVRPRDAFRRRSPAYARQGEWFFVPEPTVHVPVTLVLFDEPLSRGRGNAHIMQFAHRRGGEAVWVNRRHPRGISDTQYRRLTDEQRRGRWSRIVREPEVFAKGAIRHPDHATVVLRGWHRVAMNTEQGARAMRHVAFLD